MKYPYSLVLAQPGNKLHTLADLTVFDCRPKMQAFMRISSLGDLWRDFSPWIGNASNSLKWIRRLSCKMRNPLEFRCRLPSPQRVSNMFYRFLPRVTRRP